MGKPELEVIENYVIGYGDMPAMYIEVDGSEFTVSKVVEYDRWEFEIENWHPDGPTRVWLSTAEFDRLILLLQRARAAL